MVVKRTAMEKQVRFFFTIFSTSVVCSPDVVNFILLLKKIKNLTPESSFKDYKLDLYKSFETDRSKNIYKAKFLCWMDERCACTQ
jgi:hypothetical protein